MKPFFSTSKSNISGISAVERIADICSSLDISKLDIPSLVLHGDRVGLVNLAGGKATVKAIPKAKLKIYPRTGHDFPVELITINNEHSRRHCCPYTYQ